MRVISLARTPHRLAQFRVHNPHIAAEIVPAIDGHQVGFLEILPPHLPWTPGAVGCLMSHLLFWEQVEQAGQPMTVFEDDAVVHHRFEELSAAVLASLPEDWDICLWGWNFDAVLMTEMLPGAARCIITADQETVRANLPRFQACDIRPTAIPVVRFSGTVSYAISPHGVATLRQRIIPIPDITARFMNVERANAGIDDTISLVADQIKAFVCIPPLVVTPNDHAASTVLLPA